MKKKEINYQLLIRRICLIVLDIICIIAASILALLTRFEFDFSQIPKEFLKVIYKYGPFTIVITLIIFSLFRIYSSLWEYAGIEEVFSLIVACLVAAVAKIVIILFTCIVNRVRVWRNLIYRTVWNRKIYTGRHVGKI